MFFTWTFCELIWFTALYKYNPYLGLFVCFTLYILQFITLCIYLSFEGKRSGCFKLSAWLRTNPWLTNLIIELKLWTWPTAGLVLAAWAMPYGLCPPYFQALDYQKAVLASRGFCRDNMLPPGKFGICWLRDISSLNPNIKCLTEVFSVWQKCQSKGTIGWGWGLEEVWAWGGRPIFCNLFPCCNPSSVWQLWRWCVNPRRPLSPWPYSWLYPLTVV